MQRMALLVLGGFGLACSGSGAASVEADSGRLSDAECDNIVEIETERMRQDDVVTPSAAEVAADALDPGEANPAEYGVVIAVEQRFINQLDRTVVIENAGAELTPDGVMTYDASFDLEEPLVLAPHETKHAEFLVTVTAEDASPGFVRGFVLDAALGMQIAPYVHIAVPGTDNCGYPDGVVVRSAEGDVEVERPVSGSCGGICDVLGAIFKGMVHG